MSGNGKARNGKGQDQAGADQAEAPLPELNGKEIKFATLVMQGQTASAAYREAFSVHHWQATAVWTEAGKLRNNPQVCLWIDHARKLHLADTGCTLEGHLARLEELAQLALADRNYGAAVQAEKIRGEVAGHKTERVRIETTSPEASLEEIARLSPDLARQLAQQEGIDWQPEHDKPSGAVH